MNEKELIEKIIQSAQWSQELLDPDYVVLAADLRELFKGKTLLDADALLITRDLLIDLEDCAYECRDAAKEKPCPKQTRIDYCQKVLDEVRGLVADALEGEP